MKPAQFVRSGAVELAVYRWGEPRPQRPTVILVHGYPDAANVWQGTAAALAADFNVVAYDVRGAGRSSHPEARADYDITHLVADLVAVMDAVSPEQPVHLVCHDWGSIQCWEAVCTPALQPHIASYTSISGPGLDHAADWLRRRIASGSPRQIAQVLRQFGRSWYMFLFQLPALPETAWRLGLARQWPRLLARIEGVKEPKANPTQRSDGQFGVALYRANLLKRLLRPQPRSTEVPVQLLVATRDKFMVPQIWDDLPRFVPRLWRREIPAGHWVPLSHPQRVAELAGEFIRYAETGFQGPELAAARVQPLAERGAAPRPLATAAQS